METRIIKKGDDLAQLCKDVYGDESHYIKVAKFNNLPDYRNLNPGNTIYFPPIVNSNDSL